MEGPPTPSIRCTKANTAGGTTGYTPKKAVLDGLMYCKVTRLPRYIRVTFHTNIVQKTSPAWAATGYTKAWTTYVRYQADPRIYRSKISACKIWNSLTAENSKYSETVRLIQNFGACLSYDKNTTSHKIWFFTTTWFFIFLSGQTSDTRVLAHPPPPPPYNPLNIIWICHDGSPYNIPHEHARFKYHGHSCVVGGGEWWVRPRGQSSESGKIILLKNDFMCSKILNYWNEIKENSINRRD